MRNRTMVSDPSALLDHTLNLAPAFCPDIAADAGM